MNKNIALIFSSDSFLSNPNQILSTFYNDCIIVISHDATKLLKIRTKYSKFTNLVICERKNIRKLILGKKISYDFILIGTSESDMRIAAMNKIVLIKPNWMKNIDTTIKKYGFPIEDINSLAEYISIYKKANIWFEEINVSENMTVRALMSAKTYHTQDYSKEEIALVTAFRNLLKYGTEGDNVSYFNILYYYLSSMIAKDTEMQNIQDWAIFPSSKCNLNPEMNNFKERIRFLMNGKKPENIFLRYKQISPSHNLHYNQRLWCSRHFDSIMLNPFYRDKLRNRTVCVLDDFLTHGTSFEVVRNLLTHEKVKKIYCIALGSFEQPYIKQSYTLNGDLYSPDYIYEYQNCETLSPIINI